MNIMVFYKHTFMRRPGFEPGLPDWQSDVLDQTGRPSLQYYLYDNGYFNYVFYKS